MLCLGPKKSFLSPRLELMAQGMAQSTECDTIQLFRHPLSFKFKYFVVWWVASKIGQAAIFGYLIVEPGNSANRQHVYRDKEGTNERNKSKSLGKIDQLDRIMAKRVLLLVPLCSIISSFRRITRYRRRRRCGRRRQLAEYESPRSKNIGSLECTFHIGRIIGPMSFLLYADGQTEWVDRVLVKSWTVAT